MQQELGFLEVEASPATAAMEVMAYVSKLEALRGEIEDAEERLAELKEQEKHFSEEIIPQVLRQAGFEELKLTNGKKVSIKESLYCRLPEDAVKREEALEWLSKAGGIS